MCQQARLAAERCCDGGKQTKCRPKFGTAAHSIDRRCLCLCLCLGSCAGYRLTVVSWAVHRFSSASPRLPLFSCDGRRRL